MPKHSARHDRVERHNNSSQDTDVDFFAARNERDCKCATKQHLHPIACGSEICIVSVLRRPVVLQQRDLPVSGGSCYALMHNSYEPVGYM